MPKTLTKEQKREFARWKRRTAFFSFLFWIACIAIFIYLGVFGRELSYITKLAAAVFILLLILWGGLLQLSQRCPRCGYRVGFSLRLTSGSVPRACKRCGLKFR